ncbi:hypothetical protein JKP88DRAFT_276948 [Tribonema minus]|uniref:Uncharacterized protein n=1 Tax=Tribonema minus TaxID=303371 RepID=A0A835Z4R7_9STRA|nr:hypothetical protein JKP88DRAFT_276948 [Tribonema minus]
MRSRRRALQRADAATLTAEQLEGSALAAAAVVAVAAATPPAAAAAAAAARAQQVARNSNGGDAAALTAEQDAAAAAAARAAECAQQEALAAAVARTGADTLAFGALGKVISAQKDHFQALAAAPVLANSTRPQAAFGGRYVWTGRMRGGSSGGGGGAVTVVWDDACSADVFRLDVALPPSAADGATATRGARCVRSITSVPCPAAGGNGSGDVAEGCTWLAEAQRRRREL